MSVKHTTVSILPCWFSGLDSIVVFLYRYIIDVFVSTCDKFGELSRSSDFTNICPPT